MTSRQIWRDAERSSCTSESARSRRATGASAVIAVVVMGLYINYHRSCISPEVLHTMHEFYEIVAWMFNTVIFFIAGDNQGIAAAVAVIRSFCCAVIDIEKLLRKEVTGSFDLHIFCRLISFRFEK